MADNDITALRGHLFDTIRALKDKAAPMEIDRARAIADVAGRIIDSAKVENDFMRAAGAGATGSGFIPQALPAPAPSGAPGGDDKPRRHIQPGLLR